jgi:uncharacterized protein YndB with AHSA1/START domain
MAQARETRTAAQLPEVRLSRTFRAPRKKVFNAWSTAEQVKRWFCPALYTVPEARVEMRVGGPFDVCMRSPEGVDHWCRGRFTLVEPFDRLAIETSVFGDGGHRHFSADTRVTFADAADGTRMDVVQTYSLHDPAALFMIEGAPKGWSQTLDRLEAEMTELLRSVVHASFNLERIYDAPVARVWKALTDASAKAKWFAGPAGQWEQLERFMDVRAGGRERLKGRWGGGVVSAFDAVYHDVVQNERLIYAYEMHVDEKKISVSLATLQLAALGADRTKLAITEQGAYLDGYDDAGSREHGTGLLFDTLGASLKE